MPYKSPYEQQADAAGKTWGIIPHPVFERVEPWFPKPPAAPIVEVARPRPKAPEIVRVRHDAAVTPARLSGSFVPYDESSTECSGGGAAATNDDFREGMSWIVDRIWPLSRLRDFGEFLVMGEINARLGAGFVCGLLPVVFLLEHSASLLWTVFGVGIVLGALLTPLFGVGLLFVVDAAAFVLGLAALAAAAALVYGVVSLFLPKTSPVQPQPVAAQIAWPQKTAPHHVKHVHHGQRRAPAQVPATASARQQALSEQARDVLNKIPDYAGDR